MLTPVYDVNVLERALLLYGDALQHKLAATRFGNDFYPISCGSDVRPDRPDRHSPEVELLLKEGLAQFIGAAQNPEVPENSLRLLKSGEQRANELITLCLSLVRDGVEHRLRLVRDCCAEHRPR